MDTIISVYDDCHWCRRGLMAYLNCFESNTRESNLLLNYNLIRITLYMLLEDHQSVS